MTILPRYGNAVVALRGSRLTFLATQFTQSTSTVSPAIGSIPDPAEMLQNYNCDYSVSMGATVVPSVHNVETVSGVILG